MRASALEGGRSKPRTEHESASRERACRVREATDVYGSVTAAPISAAPPRNVPQDGEASTRLEPRDHRATRPQQHELAVRGWRRRCARDDRYTPRAWRRGCDARNLDAPKRSLLFRNESVTREREGPSSRMCSERGFIAQRRLAAVVATRCAAPAGGQLRATLRITPPEFCHRPVTSSPMEPPAQ